ncbi:hypothetical protein BX659_10644 [Orenia metallireducens]|jgi:hypothetical protein|uniref:Uncharacterized protein n=1 Tax=Orenia metallireducens TaxID=1413210 RepID=A0A285HV09_9FIRM|nr:hypothetical protein [Orenia metallireducens]PRX31012.1 hypothetical protein BX659_10644 [Orenia metallireducens]SNY39550.1 hypothetical protein SAMN06265827_12544 [Orenia metallireducens]
METNKVNLNRDNSIELLTSILLEYPIINTVDINLEEKSLKISFLIDEEITYESWLNQKRKIEQHFRLFNKFKKKNKQNIIVTKDDYNGLTRLNLSRDLEGCSKNELDFIISVLKEIFEDKLLKNQNFYYAKGASAIDSLLEEVSKDNLLEDMGREYLGFIEEDKVLVFNKNRNNA